MQNAQTFCLCFVLAASLTLSSTATDLTNQTNSLIAKWTPPQNPNPEKILDEARADAKSGKYADALTKHVWFFHNALKYDKALRGVRLSFALSDWVELGKVYPPALEKLNATRDDAKTNVFNGQQAKENFLDFESINKELNQDSKTTDFFIWLDANKPEAAKEIFDNAEPALIKSKEYRLCGKYRNTNDYNRFLQSYRMNMEIAKQYGPLEFLKKQGFVSYANKSFINKTTRLIALLVVNDRKPEAQSVVEQISKESNLPKFKDEIQKALTGEVPQPWP